MSLFGKFELSGRVKETPKAEEAPFKFSGATVASLKHPERSEITDILKNDSADANDLIRVAKLRSQEEGHIRVKKDDISAIVVEVK